jgi:hypothetical protein
MPKHPDPAGFARAILLEAADIPADMTIAQWREQKQPGHAPQPRRRIRIRSRRQGTGAAPATASSSPIPCSMPSVSTSMSGAVSRSPVTPKNRPPS